MGVLIPVVLLLLLLGALADIITSDPSRIRHLPKMFWILIVILMPLVGSILWFAVGHDYSQSVDRGGFGDPRRREQPGPAPLDTSRPVTEQPSSWQRSTGPLSTGPLSTEQELAALEREIAADRIRQLEAELRDKRRARDAGS